MKLRTSILTLCVCGMCPWVGGGLVMSLLFVSGCATNPNDEIVVPGWESDSQYVIGRNDGSQGIRPNRLEYQDREVYVSDIFSGGRIVFLRSPGSVGGWETYRVLLYDNNNSLVKTGITTLEPGNIPYLPVQYQRTSDSTNQDDRLQWKYAIAFISEQSDVEDTKAMVFTFRDYSFENAKTSLPLEPIFWDQTVDVAESHPGSGSLYDEDASLYNFKVIDSRFPRQMIAE